jgi:hypothetical protein
MAKTLKVSLMQTDPYDYWGSSEIAGQQQRQNTQGPKMNELFSNPHDALVFAFNYSSQQYALSPMAKMIKTRTSSGKGLVALDGAAQAGIIQSRMAQLPALQAACIVARYAPRFEECPCCNGRDKLTDTYREALATLAEWAISHCGGMTLRNMRGAIVRSFFERGVSISEAARSMNVPKATAYDQKARIHKALSELDLAAQRAAGLGIEDMCAQQEEIACTGLSCPV